jgi:hypothetical protein
LKEKSHSTKGSVDNIDIGDEHSPKNQFTSATWVAITLLILSWIGFAVYVLA